MIFGRLLVATILGVSVYGCGSKNVETKLPAAELNLRYIGMAYQQAKTDLGRAPKNMEEIKSVLKDFGDPEVLSRSPRDGKPYKLGKTDQLIAYEDIGQDGKRFVVGSNLRISEIDNDEFQKLTKSK